MKLFDDIERMDNSPANLNEDLYGYYLRSAREDIAFIRAELERWFLYYPEEHKGEFLNSFKTHFYDCFYELFLFRLFSMLGFAIEVHPKIPNSSSRPDFLIKRDNLELYIEAKIDKGKSHKEEAEERKKREFYDELNKVDSKDYYLCLDELKFKNNCQPKVKPVISEIEHRLENLASELVSDNGYTNERIIEVNTEDVFASISIYPRSSSSQDRKRRAIGAFPIEVTYDDGEESIKKSVIKKATKYKKLDKPFIICVNAIDECFITESEAINNAVWGSLAISYGNSSFDERLVRLRDGLFLDIRKPKIQNVSGVLITSVFPHNFSSANYRLFKHPFSHNSFDFNTLGLKYSFVDNGRIQNVIGDDMHILIGIDRDWLNNVRKR